MNNYATASSLKLNIVEWQVYMFQEYIQIDIIVQMISNLMWLLILGVKDLTENVFANTPKILSSITQLTHNHHNTLFKELWQKLSALGVNHCL